MSAHCLNCETPLQGSFCHHCGQKSSTHRITFAKFVQHDLLHGIFHLDKGVLYTLKTLIYTPGYAARDFLKGRRVMHYNIFALFIIIVALKTLVDLQISPEGVFYSDEKSVKQTDELINGAIQHYYKLFYLLSIPLLSCFSKLLFKKTSYNFVEHIVLNSFLLAGALFYSLLVSLFEFLTGISTLEVYGAGFMVIYVLAGYYQATNGLYSFFDYLWRALLVVALFLLSLILVLFAVIVFFYGGTFEGQISV